MKKIKLLSQGHKWYFSVCAVELLLFKTIVDKLSNVRKLIISQV